jgi:hypothetical protein
MTGFVRADLLISRPQDWQYLSRLGILGHFYGIETFNHRTGKAIGKGMNPQKVQDGLLKVKEHFKTHDHKMYRAIISLVLGLPHETKESLDAGGAWIQKYWQDESIDFTPLEIPIDEHTNKLAKLGKDWAGWGYTELNEPLWTPEGQSEYNRGYGRKNLIWKNEHMDVNYARQWAQRMHLDPKTPTGLNPWSLNVFSMLGYPVEEVFGVLDNHDRLVIPELARISRENKFALYKAKKLQVDVSAVSKEYTQPDWYQNLT